MSLKKLLKEYTLEEIADSMFFPAKLTARQKKESDEEFARVMQQKRASMTPEQRMRGNLLQLRFQLEDYINGNEYKQEYSFGYFLDRYLTVIGKKRKDFAADIQIHETLLSHLINNRREPASNIIIRLELHSNNNIPAIMWFKLIEKAKAYLIATDATMRKRENEFVSGKILSFA